MTDPSLYYVDATHHVCQICSEVKELTELEPVSDKPGKVWDICIECATREKEYGVTF